MIIIGCWPIIIIGFWPMIGTFLRSAVREASSTLKAASVTSSRVPHHTAPHRTTPHRIYGYSAGWGLGFSSAQVELVTVALAHERLKAGDVPATPRSL